MITIKHLDHLVLTVANIDTSCHFYETVLGMSVLTFAGNRKAIGFGQQKINLHQYQQEYEPKASVPTPGSADLCFISETPLATVSAHLHKCNVEIIDGPMRRTGACNSLLSIYFRDPDGNLIEVSNVVESGN